MHGAFYAPPLTVPPVFADGQSRRESPKMASRPFQFLEKNAPKSERGGQALWGIGRLVHPFSGTAGGGQGRV